MKTLTGVAALILLATAVIGAPTDGPNLAAPASLDAGEWSAEADFRFFDGGNTTSSFQLTHGLNDTSEAAVSFVHFDNTGPDPVAGDLRRSELDMVAVSYRLVGSEVDDGRCGVAGQLDVEVPLTWRGTNLSSGATAETDDPIIALSLPIAKRVCDKLVLAVQPKAVFFKSRLSGSMGGDAASFNDVFAVTWGGVLELSQSVSLFADFTDVWGGSNAISQRSGGPADRIGWTVGGRVESKSGNAWLVVYLTNASGLSTATSVIAAPDDEALSVMAGIAF